jgi:hypothetical protein
MAELALPRIEPSVTGFGTSPAEAGLSPVPEAPPPDFPEPGTNGDNVPTAGWRPKVPARFRIPLQIPA